jgi:hypothetical protein
MKKGVIALSLVLGLAAAPLVARAAGRADFDDDAKPILRMQPGLVQYVETHFDVKDTGQAKYPGDDDHRPGPPYIFRARPRGSDGPYTLLLLIQPGPPGRILGVVDSTKLHAAPPAGQPQPPEVAEAPQQQPYQSPTLNQGDVKPLSPDNQQPAQNPAPAPQQPAATPNAPTADTPSGPTADTPSGPIMPNSPTGTANPQQNLAPPPDPAPSNQ